MNKALLLKSDDWEGLYVENQLVDEGHKLNQGYERAIYFAELAKEHNFDLIKMKVMWLTQEDEEWTQDTGCFPGDINEFKSKYE